MNQAASTRLPDGEASDHHSLQRSRRARQSEAGGTPYTQETGEEAAPLERRRGSERHGERCHAP